MVHATSHRPVPCAPYLDDEGAGRQEAKVGGADAPAPHQQPEAALQQPPLHAQLHGACLPPLEQHALVDQLVDRVGGDGVAQPEVDLVEGRVAQGQSGRASSCSVGRPGLRGGNGNGLQPMWPAR
jgi:hypothetical protein